MNASEMARRLSQATDDLNRSETVLLPRLDAIRDAMAGWSRSVSFDRDPVSGGEVSDPTGSAALQSDSAAEDWRELECSIRRIEAEARKVFYLLARYDRRAPTPSERRMTLRENERPEDCESCARVLTSEIPPARCRVQIDEGRQLWLCRWCQDRHAKRGELPSPDDVLRHNERLRVP